MVLCRSKPVLRIQSSSVTLRTRKIWLKPSAAGQSVKKSVAGIIHSYQYMSLYKQCGSIVCAKMAPATVLVAIADGSEEVEAVGIINALRRAGIDVTVASAGPDKKIKGSRGIFLVADDLIADCKSKTFDMIALPGGLQGAEHLRDNKDLEQMLKQQKESKRWIAAICASPAVILEHHGLLEGETAVAYPALIDKIKNRGTGRVHVSNKIVTSVGPSSALELAIKMIELLQNSDAAKAVHDAMLMQ
eukprot:GHVQ01025884.1.p1 GENE.GHVQ01025884.1~~GHVQ01025884.1.p1  ORF type:complete len:246 (+),score=30.85 GHVQ01025884.1:2422-3159(+)